MKKENKGNPSKDGIVYIKPPSMEELNKRRESLLETWRECQEEIPKILLRAKERYYHFRHTILQKLEEEKT